MTASKTRISKHMRKQIEEIIRIKNDPYSAALEICVFLDDQLELANNGWFDDDEFEEAVNKEGRKVYL
jgi:hypothetical protein